MQQRIFWQARRPAPPLRALAGSVSADVAIVGGGVAGLSCAQRLIAGGASVALVERAVCGAGASGSSSGFVTPASEIQLASLIADYGADEARRLWDFVLSGVESLRADVLEHGLDCEYQVQDSLFVANSRAGRRAVQREHRAFAQLGYASTLYDGTALADVLATRAYLGGVRFGPTFSIDAFAYCRELRDRLVARGAAIFERSRVVELHDNGVRTEHGSVRARNVVVCGDRFIPALGALGDVIHHVQTFLAITKPLSERVVRELFPRDFAMTWDSDLVYQYFRMVGRDRLLLGGGDLLHTYAARPPRDLHSTVRRMLAYVARTFPGVTLEFDCAWSGMLGVSKDLLPIAGPDRARPSIWYAGAATGLPWAAALGIYGAERVLSQRSDFDHAFSPERRFTIGPRLQAVLRKPLSFAISHGVARRA